MGDKLTTDQILAQIRGGSSGDSSATAKPAAPTEPAAAPKAQVAPSDSAPSGTGDILASIRGSAGGADATSRSAPTSTADILAAARGGAGGAKSTGGAVPSGTADILAAVRGGGAVAAPASKPVAAKDKATPSETDLAAASGLSVHELIEAARHGKSPEAAEEEAEQRPPRLPGKPLNRFTPPATMKTVEDDRRGFIGRSLAVLFSPVVIAWGSLSGVLAISSLATARFMMPNVLVEPPTKFKIGPPTDYSPGAVSTKWKAQFGVWIVNAEIDGAPMLYALSTVCTHLGCTPNWLEGEQKFKCPCHGSGFYKTGVNFEGPAPRPLERMGIRLAPDGMLEVDKSVKFQQELGQWENAASFVPVV